MQVSADASCCAQANVPHANHIRSKPELSARALRAPLPRSLELQAHFPPVIGDVRAMRAMEESLVSLGWQWYSRQKAQDA